MMNIHDSKIRAITGHLTEKMADHSMKFNNAKFAKVIRVQENLMFALA